MTSSLAIIGKSGNGKTTLVRGFCTVIKQLFPDKSILLVDSDLSQELAARYGLKINNTIYGIRSGKHEYNTGIPKKMTKQEYIEWALEDILTEVDENVDIVVSWLVASKDCICPITKQMNEAVTKMIDSYDFVIFDCEFDLKYLNQLVDYPIDTTLLVSTPDIESIHLANSIFENSKKYAAEGQFGVILNKVQNDKQNEAIENINSFGLNTLGIIEDYSHEPNKEISQQLLVDAIKNFYPRLNLPQNIEL